MKKLTWQIIFAVLAAIALVSGAIYLVGRSAGRPKVSEFGKYEGYSEAVYDGTQRTSDYLTLSDGTRLAYDLIIPTRKGVVADAPLPVLFKYTPYGRAWTLFDKHGTFVAGPTMNGGWSMEAMARLRLLVMGERGRIMDSLSRDSWLSGVVNHGYIIVAMDRPGTGASFNANTPPGMETGAAYENEIISWIAAQPWSDGNVGMYGDSQNAVLQLAAASTGNPHLKAILPAAPWMEMYQAVEFPGGVFDKGFATPYDAIVPKLDTLATPVDSDSDGVLRAQAIEGHRLGSSTALAMQNPFRDSSMNGVSTWGSQDLYQFIDRINQSGTPVYLTVGWYDIFTADAFYWYHNLTVPKRLTVRPTDHSQVSANLPDLNYSNEALRWFDYWLKGIDNGIMDEPSLHYYLQDGARQGTWQTSDRWPLEDQQVATYYLDSGKAGSVASVNDGTLSSSSPTAQSASDAYTVDYTTSTGPKPRWMAFDESHAYPDMQPNDAKAVTYTTPALPAGLAITGHPVIHLWLSSDGPDLDAFVYLEQVDASGHSTYITEGDLRASHRKLDTAPFDNLGLPYQTHNQGDMEPVSGREPFELVFSLLPTSYHVPIGARIRLTVAFADAGNFDTPVLNPPPTVQILRDSAHPSYVALPVTPLP